MSAINFVVRDVAGRVERGSVDLGQGLPVALLPGQAISLNLRPDQVVSYARDGADLKVVLADGSEITVPGVFSEAGEQQADVYLSSNGMLQRVSLVADGEGGLMPSYGGAETFGKWSPDDDLYFVRGSDVSLADAEVIAPADGDVGMFATLPLLGGLGTGGAAALAAGGLAAAALVGGGNWLGNAGPAAAPEDGMANPGSGTSPTGAPSGSTPALTNASPAGGPTTSTTPVAPTTPTTPTSPTTPAAPATPTTPTGGGNAAPAKVAITAGVKSAGTTINQADHADGSTVSGTGTPGGTVAVTANGVTHTAQVDASGKWSVTFSPTEVNGGTYETPVKATLTAPGGTTASASDTLRLDTETAVSLDTASVETDGIVNAVERADGVPLGGKAEAGATVVVTVNGRNYTTRADADGNYTVTISASDVPTGETTMPVSVKSTDAYGNTATTSGSVKIDTITAVTVDDVNVERGANDGAKGVVNAAERADGVPLAGTAEAGASVIVTVGGTNYTTTAGADGKWTVTVAASDVPTGETTMPVSVKSFDKAGNTATATGHVTIDTLVNKLTSNTIEGDNKVNRLEAADGIQLGGAVEAGSAVQIEFKGQTYTATVTGDTWSATIPASAVAGLDGKESFKITATDKAGNTKTISPEVTIDTVAPDVPDTVGVDDRGSHLKGVRLGAPDHEYSFAVADGAGSTAALPHDAVANHTSGEKWYNFSGAGQVPDGSNLIVTDTDASGNSSSTFVVTNSAGVQNVVVNTNELSGHEIVKIDLDIADDSRLALTRQQVKDLAKTTDTLMVDGGVDDAVTLTGATKGAAKTIGGRSYVEYDFGGDVTVLVDSDVPVTI